MFFFPELPDSSNFDVSLHVLIFNPVVIETKSLAMPDKGVSHR